MVHDKLAEVVIIIFRNTKYKDCFTFMISEVLELRYLYNYIVIGVIKGILGKSCSNYLKQKSQDAL